MSGLIGFESNQEVETRPLSEAEAAVVVDLNKRKEEEAKLLQEQFDQALEDFIKDDSYFAEYKKFKPRGGKVLVKIFKFIAQEGLGLGTTELYYQSKLTGEWKPKSEAINERVFPIVKVIKVGSGITDPDVVPGGVYTVPYTDVVGEGWNPDFIHLVNTFSNQGRKGSMANVPEDMPQKLPKLEKEWERYKFSMPDRLEKETDNDKLVYLIPELKLEAIYGTV